MTDLTLRRPAMTFRTTRPIRRAARWLGEGWRLFGRAPITMMGLCLGVLILELAIQHVPRVGVAVSKLVVPCVGIGLWYGLDELARGGRLRAACLVEGVRPAHRDAALTSIATSLIVAATQAAVSIAVYGAPALDALLGRPSPVTATLGFALVALVPGIVPLTLLVLAPGFAAFDRLSPGAAIARSVRIVARHAPAFAAFLIAQAGLFAIALVGLGLPLLVVTPWLTAAGYAAYRDVRACDSPAP